MCVITSFISIRTIMSIRLFFGFYSNIFSNKRVNILVRAYCVIIATVVLLQGYIRVITNIYIPFLIKQRYMYLITLYGTNVCINLLFPGENIDLFLKKIRKIQPALKPNAEIPLSRILFIFFLFSRLTSHITYGIIKSRDLLNIISVESSALLIDMSLYTSHFTRIIMFEVLWHRMAMLRKQLEKDLLTVRRFEEGEEVVKIKLRTCMKIYKELLDTTQETAAPIKFMIFFSTVLLIARMLITIYLSITDGYEYSTAFAFVLEALTEFAVTMSPALLSEMVHREIDKMNSCIVTQSLVSIGDTARDAVEDALMYLRQHPFKFSIWRLFTVDMAMVLNVISLLVTYSVAMVQFAHLFD